MLKFNDISGCIYQSKLIQVNFDCACADRLIDERPK